MPCPLRSGRGLGPLCNNREYLHPGGTPDGPPGPRWPDKGTVKSLPAAWVRVASGTSLQGDRLFLYRIPRETLPPRNGIAFHCLTRRLRVGEPATSVCLLRAAMRRCCAHCCSLVGGLEERFEVATFQQLVLLLQPCDAIVCKKCMLHCKAVFGSFPTFADRLVCRSIRTFPAKDSLMPPTLMHSAHDAHAPPLTVRQTTPPITPAAFHAAV